MSARPVTITVTVDPELPPFNRRGEPVAIGVALPKGKAQRSCEWVLADAQGAAVPVQTTTLDRWGDGSIRWMLVEFRADVVAGVPAAYSLSIADSSTSVVQTGRLAIRNAGDVVVVDTGAAEFHVPRSGGALFKRVMVQGAVALGTATIDAEDIGGAPYSFQLLRTVVERAGVHSAIVRVDGSLVSAEGEAWLEVAARLHFISGLGTARVELSVTNTRPARHPGGLWDLGDPGSTLIRDLSIKFLRDGVPGESTSGSLDRSRPLEPSGPEFTVYQDSSGGANWQHANHVNRDNAVGSTFRGYRAMVNDVEVSGHRATPVVSAGAGDTRLSISVPHFWETFPKAIEADSTHVTVRMLPRHFADAHELQGGERTTLNLAVCVGADTVSDDPLFWTRSPLWVSADPSAYVEAQACGPLGAGSTVTHARYDELIAVAVEGDDSFRQRRETIDEYGWRNFGEMYADHESVGHIEPRVSHYNNQYDAVGGCATRFLLTGDPRWFVAMDELAGHVADIDLYHTKGDRAAYNGGYFWHTEHYAPAGRATHRAYSRDTGSHGGGPSAEHNYTTGLMLHYFLTGSERSRAAVVQLANWVLDMDDGAKSRFRWIDRDDTGLASGTRSPDYHGPGRGAGNSINALLDAHRLTSDPQYLDKADRLIARCVHPSDDPASIDPLDAENRWSYTVFLQALGKYLEHRAERDLVDDRYAYARIVLLRYASWMQQHERPYLDHPERLEYPTETWAAQDLRKAAVLEFAARLTDTPAERASLLERANQFVDYAISTLTNMPTSRLTRPIVLLLAYGMQRPMLSPALAATAGSVDGARARFLPIRQRVLNKLAWAGAGLSAAVIVAIVLLVS